MDVTFVLSAIIFTLLAIVVATSLFKGSSPAAEFANARSYFGHRGDGATGGLDPKQNGHVPENKKKKKKEEEVVTDDWCEISGSSHDHWDVVKSVLSEEASPHSEELPSSVGQSSSSTSSLSVPRPGSRNMTLEVDSSSEASSAGGRRSFIGLSDTELLKCAFSYPQTEGATESPEINENTNNPLKYVPGKARSHHLEMMMSKEELEEEQRILSNRNFNCL
ncbi:uncharacterized protein LOC125021984 isoform X2 [Mugil cephalus]|uniref:uncharacterized protein LOC125021984 isoform X2 n=1 Tax=Mugil cephalus TaxID=48193 RepID=UPI001FB6E754|nr:uncharacterized protein LOC125021984 isoform X2 [Mugil cephalus]